MKAARALLAWIVLGDLWTASEATRTGVVRVEDVAKGGDAYGALQALEAAGIVLVIDGHAAVRPHAFRAAHAASRMHAPPSADLIGWLG